MAPLRQALLTAAAGCSLWTVHAAAQEAEAPEISEEGKGLAARVLALAFDPNSFFGEEMRRPLVTISYTGNDYFWPVFSIAVAEGCLEEAYEELPPEQCQSRLTARMVRAPKDPEDEDSLRFRGLYLLNQLRDRRAFTSEEIRPRLRPLGVEWLEADLRACPAALDALARSEQADWVPDEVSRPGPRDTFNLVIHADKVEVVVQQFLRKSIYQGYPAEGSPGEWAVEFYEVLEPCWRSSQIASPWKG